MPRSLPHGATPKSILVIKHGALGDFILALPAIRALRARFPSARITLQTTPTIETLARKCPWFDAVDPGGRPRKLRARLALARRVRRDFDLVVDLQNSERTAALFFMATPAPAWSGVVWGASHAHLDSSRMRKHAIERLADQVVALGADRNLAHEPPDMSWAAAAAFDPAALGLTKPYALIAAMASAGRDVKLWPRPHFAALARRLVAAGLQPVFVGAAAETEAIAAIVADAPGALNLAGRTDLAGLVALGAQARVAIGNDTGPMFIAAAAGCASLVLYSRHSQPPDRCAPRGAGGVMTIKAREMADIPVEKAVAMLTSMGVLAG
jgi:ADP-heptose:LPS heptosyltransferase